MNLSYLPCIKKLGLRPSASRPVNRNFNDKERLRLVSVSKGCTSTKTECDYLNGWIKKRSHTQKSHPKVVNPRDTARKRKIKKNKKRDAHLCFEVENDFHINKY